MRHIVDPVVAEEDEVEGSVGERKCACVSRAEEQITRREAFAAGGDHRGRVVEARVSASEGGEVQRGSSASDADVQNGSGTQLPAHPSEYRRLRGEEIRLLGEVAYGEGRRVRVAVPDRRIDLLRPSQRRFTMRRHSFLSSPSARSPVQTRTLNCSGFSVRKSSHAFLTPGSRSHASGLRVRSQ